MVYWLVTKRFPEDLVQSQLDQGNKTLAMSLGLSFHLSALPSAGSVFKQALILVMARWWPVILGSHPYIPSLVEKIGCFFLLVSSA